MTRIPRPTPDQLDADQRRLHQAITGGSRATGPGPTPLADEDGRLEGPFNAMLLSPVIGDALQGLGAAVRYSGRLTDRSREIAILTVAAHWQCSYEQHVHETLAAKAGFSQAELDALRTGRPVELDDPVESAVLQTTRHLVDHRDLDDERYREAADAIGADQLFEVTTLIGYYSTLALQMRVFAVP